MTEDAFTGVRARVPAVVEHSASRLGRILQRRALLAALAVAVVEGVLVLAGVMPWWSVIALAAASLALYVAVGRDSGRPEVRTVTWVAAVSQLTVVLVPVLAAVVAALAVAVVVLVALAALVVLLVDRR
jgi:hypothetical protein